VPVGTLHHVPVAPVPILPVPAPRRNPSDGTDGVTVMTSLQDLGAAGPALPGGFPATMFGATGPGRGIGSRSSTRQLSDDPYSFAVKLQAPV
jgi:hypothetical protein